MNRDNVKNSLVVCATQLAGGVLLKMQQCIVEFMLKIFEILEKERKDPDWSMLVAQWLVPCAQKLKVPGLIPTASYVQRSALSSNHPANV